MTSVFLSLLIAVASVTVGGCVQWAADSVPSCLTTELAAHSHTLTHTHSDAGSLTEWISFHVHNNIKIVTRIHTRQTNHTHNIQPPERLEHVDCIYQSVGAELYSMWSQQDIWTMARCWLSTIQQQRFLNAYEHWPFVSDVMVQCYITRSLISARTKFHYRISIEVSHNSPLPSLQKPKDVVWTSPRPALTSCRWKECGAVLTGQMNTVHNRKLSSSLQHRRRIALEQKIDKTAIWLRSIRRRDLTLESAYSWTVLAGVVRVTTVTYRRTGRDWRMDGRVLKCGS